MSDRFSYWVCRLAAAPEEAVLVPDAKDRYVQFIDVRDLAEWLIRAGQRGLTGMYNVVGSEHDFATVLLAAARVAGYTGELITAEDDWLTAHDINYWAGPRSLPLWLPRGDAAFARRSRSRFVEAGGTERSLQNTLQGVLEDERARGLDRERRSGLTQQEQHVLLTEIDAQPPGGEPVNPSLKRHG